MAARQPPTSGSGGASGSEGRGAGSGGTCDWGNDGSGGSTGGWGNDGALGSSCGAGGSSGRLGSTGGRAGSSGRRGASAGRGGSGTGGGSGKAGRTEPTGGSAVGGTSEPSVSAGSWTGAFCGLAETGSGLAAVSFGTFSTSDRTAPSDPGACVARAGAAPSATRARGRWPLGRPSGNHRPCRRGTCRRARERRSRALGPRVFARVRRWREAGRDAHADRQRARRQRARRLGG